MSDRASRRTLERCRTSIVHYAQAQLDSGVGPTPAQLDVQAERAAEVVQALSRRSTLVLDDPVGTGKTVVALAAAKELLERRVVTKTLVVAPNQQTAKRWKDRAADVGGLPRAALTYCTTQSLDQVYRLPGDRSRLLVIVDEAHRGLHKPSNVTYRSLQGRVGGSRMLLVTATPFQMSAQGLINMLSIGRGGSVRGVDDDLRPLLHLGQSMSGLLRKQHEMNSRAEGLSPSAQRELARDLHAAREKLYQAEANARAALDKYFVTTYPREAMNLPKMFEIPAPQPVHVPADWLRAFHVARLVPDLLSRDPQDILLRNSDHFMRMLTSSAGALLTSAAWRRFSVQTRRGAGRKLRGLLEDAMADPHSHPKVKATVDIAARAAKRHRRHVLIFCFYRATLGDITGLLRARPGAGRSFEVMSAGGRSQLGAGTLRDFRRPVSRNNPPRVLVASDALSESVDLDGGRPVVIHHDLSWSPVRFEQRMGRVVRLSSGFELPPLRDVTIPCLDVGIDRRIYDSLVHRRQLALGMVAREGRWSHAFLDLDDEGTSPRG